MAKLIAIITLTSLIFITQSSSMTITVCDCKKPKHVGIMDTETTAYCRKENKEDPILANYRFFVNEEPHMSWEGYVCKAWLKRKQ
jgi:hypothetical protein